MNHLLGQHEIAVEDGRILLPPQFAAKLGPSLAAWVSPDHAIRVASRDEARGVIPTYVDVDLDPDGHLPLPPELVHDAGLGEDALVIGMFRFFEIWSPAQYAVFSQNRLA